MPWQELTIMSQRYEFVRFALSDGASIAQLCRRFNISRKTGYKWINRFIKEGYPGLVDRSRKPNKSPNKTCAAMQNAILQMRKQHTAWGGRKIRKRLKNLGWQQVPAASTITEILKRNGLINPVEALKHEPWKRFEAPAPNDLWQMDFKGHFAASQGRCHPLTVLDDHSRYALGLQACSNEQGLTVQQRLVRIFERYGLPNRMLMDNGAPWGSDTRNNFTWLTVWLIRQRIKVLHSRPFHPQTLGKDERFHRTFKAEIGQYCIGLDLEECQKRFDAWRNIYNLHRPHESLDMQVPTDRYQQSNRQYEHTLPPIEYGPDDEVRKVQQEGWVSFKGTEYRVPKAFYRQRIAVRRTKTDGLFDVYFCNQRIAQINVKEQKSVTHVSERV